MTVKSLLNEKSEGATKVFSFDLPGNHEPVTQSANCLNIFGFARIILDFLPQTVDVNHNGVFIDDRLAPDHFVDHILWENTVDVVDKQLHHGVFLGGQDDLAAAGRALVGVQRGLFLFAPF